MICQSCGATGEESDPRCRVCGAMLSPPRLVSAQMKGAPAAQQGTSQPVTIPLSAEAGRTAQTTSYTRLPEESWAGPSSAQPIGSSPSPQWPAASARLPSARKRRRRWPWYLLLTLVVLGVVLSGRGLLLVRPVVHRAVDDQIRQGLQRAIEDIPPLAAIAPAGVPFPVTEKSLNTYIAQHTDQLTPITNMHVSLQPEALVITFQTYGFGSTIRLGLSVVAGHLVVQNVEVSGLLWWVESPSELTPRLNQALSQIPGKLRRAISSIRIADGVMLLLFA